MKNVLLWVLAFSLTTALNAGTQLSKANTEYAASVMRAPVGGAYLVFAGKLGGNVSVKEIQGQRELGVDGCAKGSRIFKYTLEVTKGKRTTSFSADSNVLTPEMQNALRNLSPGDSFTFKQIKAYLPNGKEIVDVHGKEFIVV